MRLPRPVLIATQTNDTFMVYFFIALDLTTCLFHLVGVGVGSNSLASHTGHNIDVTAVVLHALLGPSPRLLLDILLLLDLGGLALNLTGTCERSVNLSHFCLCFCKSYPKIDCDGADVEEKRG